MQLGIFGNGQAGLGPTVCLVGFQKHFLLLGFHQNWPLVVRPLSHGGIFNQRVLRGVLLY